MAEMKVDGHRADIVILKTALAHASFNTRETITKADILVGAELALPHRLKRQPFQDTSVQFQELAERLEQVRQDAEDQLAEQQISPGDTTTTEEKKTIVNR